MKKNPAKQYEKESGKKPVVATMACESQLRRTKWLQNGCNAFGVKRPISQPMSFWTEQDVLEYIRRYGLQLAPVYGDVVLKSDGCKLCTTGCDRTGCIFCGFGSHSRSDERFLRLKETHPRQYEYCISGGEYNEDGVWMPNKQGLGMGHVFDEINKIYGENFIRYK
jgi:3'-phosphoadenosine 5'-phosphosulfate sulfotransferase (PAPS reductase)/FAD synthetase